LLEAAESVCFSFVTKLSVLSTSVVRLRMRIKIDFLTSPYVNYEIA